jgi:mRNA interferase HicA
VKGSEFLRRARRLARRRGWTFAWHPEHGKGSHGTLYLNGRVTTVCDLKRELKKGTLHAMLAQLAIELRDLLEG